MHGQAVCLSEQIKCKNKKTADPVFAGQAVFF